jgi:hypothetical protein
MQLLLTLVMLVDLVLNNVHNKLPLLRLHQLLLLVILDSILINLTLQDKPSVQLVPDLIPKIKSLVLLPLSPLHVIMDISSTK